MRRQANVRFALLASWLIFKRSSYLHLQADTRCALSVAALPCGSIRNIGAALITSLMFGGCSVVSDHLAI